MFRHVIFVLAVRTHSSYAGLSKNKVNAIEVSFRRHLKAEGFDKRAWALKFASIANKHASGKACASNESIRNMNDGFWEYAKSKSGRYKKIFNSRGVSKALNMLEQGVSQAVIANELGVLRNDINHLFTSFKRKSTEEGFDPGRFLRLPGKFNGF